MNTPQLRTYDFHTPKFAKLVARRVRYYSSPLRQEVRRSVFVTKDGLLRTAVSDSVVQDCIMKARLAVLGNKHHRPAKMAVA